MKPNTIELFPDGRIGAYEMPKKYDVNTSYTYQDVLDGIDKEKKALESARREAVYFKPDETKPVPFMQVGKPYPVPDGYEVKVGHEIKSILKEDQWNPISEKNYNDGINSKSARLFNKYAILVPKGKPVY